MNVEHKEGAQIAYLNKSDFIDVNHFNYFKLIGIGITPKSTLHMFNDIFTEVDSISKDKHLIFIINDVWREFGTVAKKVLLDHEFGHLHSGQLDGLSGDGEGAVVIDEWEFVADDMAVERNGKEVTLKALLEVIEILNDNPMYSDNGESLWRNSTIIARLNRLGYKEQ